MADTMQSRSIVKETLVPGDPERLRGKPAFKADTRAHKHFPPIADERRQMSLIKRLGKK